MKRAYPASLLLLLTLLSLPPSARAAEEAKAVVKIGGNFEVETAKDIAYYDGNDADPIKHKLDLYLPKGKKDFPVLFFVHGGSWSRGDRQRYEPLGNVFAKNGIGTVIISYRLSPQVQHPGHIQDVARAYAWTCSNIGKHGGKSDQIIACGHSAGGHLVALLATDERYLKAEKRSFADIKAVIPISGVYTLTPPKLFEPVFGKSEEVIKNASPLVHVKEKLVPFCLIYAETEFPGLALDKMAAQMCDKLQGCKCDASLVKIKERDHVSIIRRAAADEEDETTQAILEFVAKHSGLKLMPKETK
jgi:hypothetical protein